MLADGDAVGPQARRDIVLAATVLRDRDAGLAQQRSASTGYRRHPAVMKVLFCRPQPVNGGTPAVSHGGLAHQPQSQMTCAWIGRAGPHGCCDGIKGRHRMPFPAIKHGAGEQRELPVPPQAADRGFCDRLVLAPVRSVI